MVVRGGTRPSSVGNPLRNLSTITPAWLLGKKVVTMAAIFGRGLERWAGPTAGSREASSAGSFLAGPEQAPPPSSTRVAARPSRRQGTRGKTRVGRDNRMGRAEMGKEDIVSWETGDQGLDHPPAAEPGHHPPPDRRRCFQSADPVGFGSGSRIRSARGWAVPACRRWRWRYRWAGAPDPGRSWSSRCPGPCRRWRRGLRW